MHTLAHALFVFLCLAATLLPAAVPELAERIGAEEAAAYSLIYKVQPTQWGKMRYDIDNADAFTTAPKRVGYLLVLKDKEDKEKWTFVSMRPFSDKIEDLGVPFEGGRTFQCAVHDLSFRSNVRSNGDAAEGSIEFWPTNYVPARADDGVEGSDTLFDHADKPENRGTYGSMQIHLPAMKTTLLAFNNLLGGANCDLGIGNAPEGNPDWTFSKSAASLKEATLYVVGQFDTPSKAPLNLDAAKLRLVGTTDVNPTALKVHETVAFSVRLLHDGQPVGRYTLKWTLDGDDGLQQEGEQPADAEKPLVVTATQSRPGFVRLVVKAYGRGGLPLRNGQLSFDGGAGFDIAKIQKACPEPADFDAYWAKQKAKLAAVPIDVLEKKELEPLAKGFRIWQMKIACAGPRPVTGYLIIPDGDKKLPARAFYYGYNYRPYLPQKNWFIPGIISFRVNAHGCELGASEEYYREFSKSIRSGKYDYAFDPEQNRNPDTSYFYGMAMRVMRSLQFLETLPEWNGRDLQATGYSQGGLQACWAAGLLPEVTYCQADIPWNGDIGGYTKGRVHGPWHLDYVPGLEYFDTVNHIRRAKCPFEIPRAGLGDYTCPPSGVTALYNAAPGPKRITYVQGSTHGYVPPQAERFTLQVGDVPPLK